MKHKHHENKNFFNHQMENFKIYYVKVYVTKLENSHKIILEGATNIHSDLKEAHNLTGSITHYTIDLVSYRGKKISDYF